MKVYVMVAAYHHNMNNWKAEILKSWAKVCKTRTEAIREAKADISREVNDFYWDSLDEGEIDATIREIIDRGNPEYWEWRSADHLMTWRVIEDDIAVTVHEDDNDTTMDCLGYRGDDNADAGVIDDRPPDPRLVISLKYISTGWEGNIDFSSLEDARNWATFGRGSETDYRSGYQPLAIKVLQSDGSMREVYDCQGSWEALEGELAYAIGDDGSFADPKDLEERNNKYKEWYD